MTAERSLSGETKLPTVWMNLARFCFCSYLIILISPSISIAGINHSAVCDKAAAKASNTTRVPFKILKAIARTETGRNQNGSLEPWAWTVNVEGKGRWFPSRNSAQFFILSRLKAGTKNIDIGCFQLNYRWHGNAFASIDEMLDPYENAQYAARFLKQLFDETGNWSDAIRSYHSRTKENADRYKKRFDKIFANLVPRNDLVPSNTTSETHGNDFPLLKRTPEKPLLGSLVPLSAPSRGHLFERNEGRG